jgi:hypothetical protein
LVFLFGAQNAVSGCCDAILGSADPFCPHIGVNGTGRGTGGDAFTCEGVKL